MIICKKPKIIQECLDILAARCASCNCMTYFSCAPLQSCRGLYQLGDWLPPLIPACFWGGSHLPADIAKSRKSPISIVENNKQWIELADLIISERVSFLLIYCGAVILLWTNSETDCECGFEQIRTSWFESFNEYAYLNQNYLMNTHILLRIINNQSNRHHSWKKWILMNLSYTFQSFNKNPEWI